MPECTLCHQSKPVSEMVQDRSRALGYRNRCRPCDSERSRATYARNRDNKTETHRNQKVAQFYRQIQRFYLMSSEEYDARYSAQGGCCVACGSPEDVLYVDHDHACCPGRPTCGGCARQLLCDGCNKALGFARDNPVVLRNLALLIDAA